MKREPNISPEVLEVPAALLTRFVASQPFAREGIRCLIGTRCRLPLSRVAGKRVGEVGVASRSSGPLWDLCGRHRSLTPSRPRDEGMSPGVADHRKAPPRSLVTVGRFDDGWSPPGWDGSKNVCETRFSADEKLFLISGLCEEGKFSRSSCFGTPSFPLTASRMEETLMVHELS